MAGQLPFVPLLIGMGVDELSMNVHSVPKVKKLLNSITEKESREIAEGALKLRTATEVRGYVVGEIVKKWSKDLPGELMMEVIST
jgi:phosphoenolpyruvate-protein kinase (PTS system EI component)